MESQGIACMRRKTPEENSKGEQASEQEGPGQLSRPTLVLARSELPIG